MEEKNKEVSSTSDAKQIDQLGQDEDESATECSSAEQGQQDVIQTSRECEGDSNVADSPASEKDPLLQENQSDAGPCDVSEDVEPMEIDSPPLGTYDDKLVSVNEQHCDSVSESDVLENSPVSLGEKAEYQEETSMHDSTTVENSELSCTADSRVNPITNALDDTATEKSNVNNSEHLETGCLDHSSAKKSQELECIVPKTSSQSVEHIEKSPGITSECILPVDSECLKEISPEESSERTLECISPITSSHCVDPVKKSSVPTSECVLPVDSEFLDQTSVEKSPVIPSELILPVEPSECLDHASIEKLQESTPECLGDTSTENSQEISSECILPAECSKDNFNENLQEITSECILSAKQSECSDDNSTENSQEITSECILPEECLDDNSNENSQENSSEWILPAKKSECSEDNSIENSQEITSECILPEESTECLPSTSTAEEHHELRPIKMERPDSARNSPEMLCGYPLSDNSDAEMEEECQFEVTEVSYPWPQAGTSEEVHQGCSRYQLSPALEQRAITNIMARLENEQIPLAQSEIFKEIYKVVDDARVTHIVFSRPIMPLKLMIPLLQKYPEVNEKMKQIKTMHANFELERILSNPTFERNAVEGIKKRMLGDKRSLTSQEIFHEIMRLARELGSSTKIFPYDLNVNLTHFLDRNPEIYVLSEHMKNILECRAGQFSPALEKRLLDGIMDRLQEEKYQVREYIVLEHAVKLAAETGVTRRVFTKDKNSRHRFLKAFLNRHPEVFLKIREVNKNVMAIYPEICMCKAYKLSESLELKVLERLLDKLENCTTLVTPIDIFREAVKVARTAGVLTRVFPEYPKPSSMTKFLEIFMMNHPELRIKMQCANELLRHSQQTPERDVEEEEDDEAPVEFEVFYVDPATKQGNAKSTGECSRIQASGNSWMNDQMDLVKPCSVVLDRSVVEQYLAPVDLSLVAEVSGRRRANLLATAKLNSTHTSPPEGKRRIARNPKLAQALMEDGIKKPKKRRSRCVIQSSYKKRKTVARAVSPPSASDFLNNEFEILQSEQLNSEPLQTPNDTPEIPPAKINQVKVAEPGPSTSFQITSEMTVGKRRIARNSKLAKALMEDNMKKARGGKSKFDVYSKYKRRKAMPRAVSPPSASDFLNDEFEIAQSEPHPISGTTIQTPASEIPPLKFKIKKSKVRAPAEPGPSTNIQIKSELTVEEHGPDSNDHYDLPQEPDDDDDAASVGSGCSDYSVDIDFRSSGKWHKPDDKEAATERLKMVYFMRTQAPNAVPCLYCHWIFRDVLRLANHVNRVHSQKNDSNKPAKKDNYICKDCVEPFGTKLFYQLHVYERHDRLYLKIPNKPKILGSSTAVEAKLNYYSHNAPMNEPIQLYLTGRKKKKVLIPSYCNPNTKQREILKPRYMESDVAKKYNSILMEDHLENTFRNDQQSKIAQNSRTSTHISFPNAWQPSETVSQSTWQPRITNVQSIKKPEDTGVQNAHPVKETHIQILQPNPFRSTSPCQPTILAQQAKPSSNISEPITTPFDVSATCSQPGIVAGTHQYKICCICKNRNVLEAMTPVLRRTGLGFCCNVCITNSTSSKDGTPVVNTLPPQTLVALQNSQVSKSKKIKTTPIQFVEVPSPAPKTNANMGVEITSDPCTYIANEARSGVQHILNKAAAASGPSSSDATSPLRPVAMISVKSLKTLDILGLEKGDVPTSLKIVTVQQLDNNVAVPMVTEPHNGLVAKDDESTSKFESGPDTTEETLHIQCQILKGKVLQCNECTKLMKIDKASKATITQQLVCVTCLQARKTSPRPMPAKSPVLPTPNADYLCMYCRLTFSGAQTLVLHSNSCQKESVIALPCPDCNFKFTRLDSLAQHIASIHQINKGMCIKEHKCSLCSNRFLSQVTLKTHFIVDHHTCNICNQKFQTSKLCFEHMRVHLKQDIAEGSSKQTPSKQSDESGLKQTVTPTSSTSRQSDEPGLKPIIASTTPGTSKQSEQPGLKQSNGNWMKCSHCPLIFKDFKSLFEHKMTHHPPPTETSQVLATRMVPSASDSPSPSMFNCKACNQSFLTLELIRKHLREKHRLYNCCKCNKFFLIMKKDDPMQGFLGDARFICSLCDTDTSADMQQSSDMLISNVVTLESEEYSQNTSELKIMSVTSLSNSPEKSSSQDEGLKISSIVSLQEEEKEWSEPEFSIPNVTTLAGSKLSSSNAENHLRNVTSLDGSILSSPDEEKSEKSKENAENMTEEMVTSDVEMPEVIPMDASEN